jgi:hypothetical protein
MNEGWVSSGGELVQNGQNPFWVKNTKTVGYCIQFDAPSMSISEGTARQLVLDSIDFWKKEFAGKPTYFRPTWHTIAEGSGGSVSGKNLPPGQGNHLGVGIQDFIEVSCDAAWLVIQFGYGTLTPAQRTFMKKPTKYIAAVIRTDYDPVQLVGKGNLVVGSDQGKETFVTPSSGISVERPWRMKRLLLGVLIHEFGHVFGLVHRGHSSMELMAERFPDAFLRSWRPEWFEEALHWQEIHRSDDYANFGSFFAPPNELGEYLYEFLHSDPKLDSHARKNSWDFFEPTFPMPSVTKDGTGPFPYLQFTFSSEKETAELNLTLHSPLGPDKDLKETLGTIKDLNFRYSIETALSLQITSEQKVFENPGELLDRLIGPSVVTQVWGKAIFVSRSGREKQLSLTLNEGGAGFWNFTTMEAISGTRFIPLNEPGGYPYGKLPF